MRNTLAAAGKTCYKQPITWSFTNRLALMWKTILNVQFSFHNPKITRSKRKLEQVKVSMNAALLLELLVSAEPECKLQR